MDQTEFAAWMQKECARVTELSNHLREHVIAIPSGSLTVWIEELGKHRGGGRLSGAGG